MEYLNIPYEIDHRMINWLGYYNRTILEIMIDGHYIGRKLSFARAVANDGFFRVRVPSKPLIANW